MCWSLSPDSIMWFSCSRDNNNMSVWGSHCISSLLPTAFMFWHISDGNTWDTVTGKGRTVHPKTTLTVYISHLQRLWKSFLSKGVKSVEKDFDLRQKKVINRQKSILKILAKPYPSNNNNILIYRLLSEHSRTPSKNSYKIKQQLIKTLSSKLDVAS